MVLLTLWGLWLVRRRRLTDVDDRWIRRFHLLGVVAVALPFLANITGWIMTEMGRQPWIVFGVMTTDQALSPNMTTFTIALSLILFTLIYGVLAVVEGWLVVRHIRSGPEPEPEDEGADETPTEDRRVSVLVAY
jgi:cytochrome d ubiquinol oxidase subunit I